MPERTPIHLIPQWFRIARTLPCGYCHVDSFQVCRVREGSRTTKRPAKEMHEARFETAKLLFNAGAASIDGQGDTLMHVMAAVVEGQKYGAQRRLGVSALSKALAEVERSA